MISTIAVAFAAAPKWKTGTSKDGKITAIYRIGHRIDENGKRFPLIEYRATTIDNVSMQRCIAVMKDVSNHKEFHDEEISKTVKTVSDNEWIIYYYNEGAGPFPNSDAVYRMKLSEDSSSGSAVFTLGAEPTMHEAKEAKRIRYADISYEFKDLGNDTTKVTIATKMSPPFKVPAWILKAAFPKVAFTIVRNFVTYAKEIH
ncbi:MAG: hypothetical protein GF363_06830 [Chitinivibrionales bacterium]|nr:hypothetical protein [Chitinivibrionales bacterium]